MDTEKIIKQIKKDGVSYEELMDFYKISCRREIFGNDYGRRIKLAAVKKSKVLSDLNKKNVDDIMPVVEEIAEKMLKGSSFKWVQRDKRSKR